VRLYAGGYPDVYITILNNRIKINVRLNKMKKMLIGTILSVLFISVSIAEKIPVKIICFGDSITKAARLSRDKSFIGLVEQKLKKQGFSVQVINSGMSGDKTDNGVARFNKSVLDLKPDIVIIMFGCNDSFIDRGKTIPRLSIDKFEKNLNFMVDELRKKRITPILMTTTSIDNTKVNYYPYSFHGSNHYLKPYIEVVKKIAKAKNIALVDHFDDWKKYCMQGGKAGDLLFDNVHPNEAGYQRMSNKMYPVLLNVLMHKNVDHRKKKISNPGQKNKNLAFGKSYISSSRNKKDGWQEGLTDGKKTKKDQADSIIGGYATGPDPKFPKTIVMDLEANVEASRVLLYNMAKYGTKTVTVSVSTDGKSFEEVGTHVFKKSDGKVYNYKFPKQKIRFVKIAFIDCYKMGHYYLFLREVEVYED
jgi:acyl-CoA thioesterase I